MNTYTKNILKDNVEFSYTKNGNIEILISPKFGAGWSTWNTDKFQSINLAVDKRIIDFFKQKGQNISYQEINEFLISIGYKDVYVGGWSDLVIKTVKPNEEFRITEYDGSESLIRHEEDEIWEL